MKMCIPAEIPEGPTQFVEQEHRWKCRHHQPCEQKAGGLDSFPIYQTSLDLNKLESPNGSMLVSVRPSDTTKEQAAGSTGASFQVQFGLGTASIDSFYRFYCKSESLLISSSMHFLSKHIQLPTLDTCIYEY